MSFIIRDSRNGKILCKPLRIGAAVYWSSSNFDAPLEFETHAGATRACSMHAGPWGDIYQRGPMTMKFPNPKIIYWLEARELARFRLRQDQQGDLIGYAEQLGANAISRREQVQQAIADQRPEWVKS